MKIANPSTLNTLHPAAQPGGDSKMETSLVTMQNGVPATTSLVVGETFDKRHDNVVRDIELLISAMNECTEGFNALNSEAVKETSTDGSSVASETLASHKIMNGDRNYFIKTTYIDSKNESRPMYIITEEGFALLAMGFTGKKALEFKLKFLDEYKALVTENRRLQAENLTLLENKTKLLEKKVAAFDAKTFEIRDRNSYLEKKRALFIDDHIIKEVTQAYEEATRELRETQDLMYSREWAEGTTKPLAKCLQKLIMARMRNILRVTKNLRKFFKGSELETEYLLNRYIDEIEVEAKHLQW